MSNMLVKTCVFFVYWSLQTTLSYPQFSIPLVSWNKNSDRTSKFPLNLKVEHPLTLIFGKGNARQEAKTNNKNEVLSNEKIVTVTPNYITNNDGYKNIENGKQNIFQSKDSKKQIEVKNTDNNLEDSTETIETTTDFETTTFSDDDIANRVSGQVVASLLG